MSKSKQLWEDEVEQIAQDFVDEKITHEEARRLLVAKGFDPALADQELGELLSD